ALGSVEVGVGLGMGLFGILSIIRLRSDQITQQEIAYYFTALALGLLAGLHPEPMWLTPVLSALVILAIAILDSPLIASSTHRHRPRRGPRHRPRPRHHPRRRPLQDAASPPVRCRRGRAARRPHLRRSRGRNPRHRGPMTMRDATIAEAVPDPGMNPALADGP